MNRIFKMNQSSHDKSMNFLIYAFYAILLWCIYYGFTQIYINLFDDFVVGELGHRFLFDFDYGQAATLVLLSTLGFFVVRHYSHKLSKEKYITIGAGSRLWMLRLILFAASLSAIVDLYSLISALMTGYGATIELYKSFITLIVALGIIFFCIDELRSQSLDKISLFTPFSTLFVLISIITFISALYVAPPWVMKKAREDVERVRIMNSISYTIDDYFSKHQKVPQKIEDLEQFVNVERLNDPATKKPFEYRAINENTYEMCADFKTNKTQARRIGRFYGNFDEFNYMVGKSCFQLKAHIKK